MSWREAIAERCKAIANVDDEESKRIRKRRAELEEEQKRLINVYTKGYITEQEMDEKMERIRTELFALPILMEKGPERAAQETLSAGETLMRMVDYWNEATEEERRDMVWSLLNAEGLLYDPERHVIIGLKPRTAVLPVLALGLEATSMWEQREEGLWLREGPCPQRGNHLRAFKCEMIDVLFGQLSGSLTPTARMIPLRVVISNRPAY